MSFPSRMPRYDVRNDGMGPYAIFFCESCDREFRSQADVKNTVTTDLGRKVAGDLLRKVPLFGGSLAENVAGRGSSLCLDPHRGAARGALEPGREAFSRMPDLQKGGVHLGF